MKCWICGNHATTGEHRVKASDLKAYFGHVSQQSPIYTHTDIKRNIPVKSIRADRLKSKGLICNDCNSSRTQQYDKAWEKLSQYLQQNWQQIQKSQHIDLTKVFRGSTRRSLLNVHLFFVKIFGCAIAEYDIPIDLMPFSRSLIENTPHPNVHLAFTQTPGGEPKKKLAAVTPMQAVNLGNRCIWGGWMYIVGNVTVYMIYNEVPGNTVLSHTWNPLRPSKVVPIKRMHA